MKTAKRAAMPIFTAAVRRAVAENRERGIRFEYMDNGRRRVESGGLSEGRMLMKSSLRSSNKNKLKVG